MLTSSTQVTGTSTTTATSSASQVPGGLGKDDFLKLLVGQLKNQNPMNPMGDQDFIAQMAQFSMLEQVTNMAASSKASSEALGRNQAVALMGKTVSFARGDGTTGQGIVEKVTFTEAGASLTVAGEQGIDPKKVTEVR